MLEVEQNDGADEKEVIKFWFRSNESGQGLLHIGDEVLRGSRNLEDLFVCERLHLLNALGAGFDVLEQMFGLCGDGEQAEQATVPAGNGVVESDSVVGDCLHGGEDDRSVRRDGGHEGGEDGEDAELHDGRRWRR